MCSSLFVQKRCANGGQGGDALWHLSLLSSKDPATRWGLRILFIAGNAFDPLDKAAEFGLDALKYFVLRESSFSDDGVLMLMKSTQF